MGVCFVLFWLGLVCFNNGMHNYNSYEPFSISFLIQLLNLEPTIRTQEKKKIWDHHIIPDHLILRVLQWDLKCSGDRKKMKKIKRKRKRKSAYLKKKKIYDFIFLRFVTDLASFAETWNCLKFRRQFWFPPDIYKNLFIFFPSSNHCFI